MAARIVVFGPRLQGAWNRRPRSSFGCPAVAQCHGEVAAYSRPRKTKRPGLNPAWRSCPSRPFALVALAGGRVSLFL